jgi:hypothetical protein
MGSTTQHRCIAPGAIRLLIDPHQLVALLGRILLSQPNIMHPTRRVRPKKLHQRRELLILRQFAQPHHRQALRVPRIAIVESPNRPRSQVPSERQVRFSIIATASPEPVHRTQSPTPDPVAQAWAVVAAGRCRRTPRSFPRTFAPQRPATSGTLPPGRLRPRPGSAPRYADTSRTEAKGARPSAAPARHLKTHTTGGGRRERSSKQLHTHGPVLLLERFALLYSVSAFRSIRPGVGDGHPARR